ncbi:MAG: DegT/DnrJ/EryC1/StrS family aminotransferase, partial [Candidatus Poribacteria bacterium]
MEKSKLAINGGPKAIDSFEGKSNPKIDHAELLEMADTWGYPSEIIEEIRKVVEKVEVGPSLVHYGNPRSKATQVENIVRELFNVKHVMGVSSGTAALHSAYVAADIGCGDEVLVPGYTFAATAMAVVVARGIPIWCEIDESMTIDPNDVEKKITPRTKAIAPVHMNGFVCNMDAIMDIAKRHNLKVIEDCAQSCGARFKGKRVGTIGDIGCFSISSYKVTGGGESGIVMTNDDKLFARVQQWAEAGGLWRPDRFAPARWKGELFCGLNYRMSELEGTVELVQFRKMEAQLDRWRKNKKLIMSNLPVYKELRPRVIHDIDGEMGHSIGFFGRTAEEAEKLASAISAEGVSAGTRGTSTSPDWHYYQYMEMILNKVPATSDGCPWECPKAGESAKIKYSFDMCPNCIDLTSRHISVGVNQW